MNAMPIKRKLPSDTEANQPLRQPCLACRIPIERPQLICRQCALWHLRIVFAEAIR